MEFSLERFEHAVYNRQYEVAGKELMQLLQMLDNHYGNLAPSFSAKPMAALSNGDEVDAHILTRIASAISHLFLDPAFTLSPQGQSQALQLQRWLATLFAVTPFRNADHVLRSMNNLGWDQEELQLTPENLNKFGLLAFPDSEIPINLDALWTANPVLAVSLAMLWLAPRFLASPSAHSKREIVLGWLPGKLEQMDLDQLPSGILHDVYMHCSYADRPDRHNVKASINVIVRNKMLQNGLADVLPKPAKAESKGKPVMLVALEWFNNSHSMYRCYAPAIRACKEHFHTIGLGYAGNVDADGREVFTEFIELAGNSMIEQVANARHIAENRNIDVFFMPSVGMFPITIFLANIRLAPVQIYALGHPATTFSKQMDYVVQEPDTMGLPECYSEKFLIVANKTFAYVLSASTPKNLDTTIKNVGEKIKIAICATTMKINPNFLSACKSIAVGSKKNVEFHFMIGQATALVKPQVDRVIKQFLGDKAVIYPHQSYEAYLSTVASCDMYINPFPFGNTNGIIDTTLMGLAGVCKKGRETFEISDSGLFRKIGLPDWLSANSVEDYVSAAIRLINNDDERNEIRKNIISKDLIKNLLEGNPSQFANAILEIL